MFKKLFGSKPGNTAPTSTPPANRVDSLCHPGEQIEVTGFHHLESCAHMMPWLGRGPNASVFLANDVESELIQQQPGSRLISLECAGEPSLETQAFKEPESHIAQVGGLTAVFPLVLLAKDGGGATWCLVVNQRYVATGLAAGGEHRIQMDFSVVDASAVG